MNPELSKNLSKKIDNIYLKKSIINIFIIALGVVMAFLSFRTGNRILMIGVLALPIALMLMNRLELAFILSVILEATGFSIGNVNYLTPGIVLQILIIVSSLLNRSISGRDQSSKYFIIRKPLIFFALLIFIIIFARGAGLRFLGSETWGGGIYIQLLVLISFILSTRELYISPKLFKKLIIFTFFASIIACFNQRMGWASEISELSTIGPINVKSQRLIWLLPFIIGVFPIALAIKWKTKMMNALVWLLFIGMMGLTGFRSRLVGLFMVTFFVGLMKTKNKVAYFGRTLLITILLWVLAIIVSPIVPAGLQRAISFIPGTYVESATDKDAIHSIEWRLEIWKYCLERVPEYFVLGRGSAFNVRDAVADLTRTDIMFFSPWFAFLTRSYHSGPLTLLIDYGFAGLLIGSWLLFSIAKSAWDYGTSMNQYVSLSSRYCQVLCAWLFWEVLSFYLVYGQMAKMGNILALAAVVTVLARSIEKYKETHSNKEIKI